MASFKGIKERINSIRTTRKITSAMKMISAAKLHRAQKAIESMLPYSGMLERILTGALAGQSGFRSPLMERRDVKKVAIVAFSSDSSLAGSFNANVARELKAVMDKYRRLGKDNISLYTIGKKVFEASRKYGYKMTQNFENLAAKPDYDTITGLADNLTKQFLASEIDCVEIIYHHFKSAGSQLLTCEEYLPLALPETPKDEKAPDDLYYIFEPSRDQILEDLLPRTLRLKMYTALLDSNASEHAARLIAMQIATDNADDLINELVIEYNKSRQQAITNELLDIFGGQAR